MSYGFGSKPAGPGVDGNPGGGHPTHDHPQDGQTGNDHLALIYDDRHEQLTTVAQFVRQGLERDEQCLYVVDDNTRADVIDALEAAGIDTQAACESGALSIHTKADTYLDDGAFDRDEMLRFWERFLEQAKDRDGFEGLRAAAEMTWALDGDVDREDLAAYEALLNRLYDGEDYTVLCQYNRTRFPSETISDVLRTHPLVVDGTTVRRNAHYRPPEEFINSNAWADDRPSPGAAADRSGASSRGSTALASKPSPGADTTAERPVRILYVDDEPGYAETAAEFIEFDDGIDTVATTTSPRTALDRLDEEPFDCVVSDYDMPGLDGLELLEAVREHHPDLPFILVTGRGDEVVASDAISAGVTDYLRKTGDTEQYSVLVNRISNAVERYRNGRAIERTRRQYRRLIEESTDVITVVDESGRFEYLSPAAERRLGYSAEELIGDALFEYVHPDDRPTTEEQFDALVEESRQRLSVEFRFERRDGSWMWLEVRARDALDDPDVEGIIAHARDVTERTERERALRESERRFRSLFEEAFDAMVVVDDDARCIDANPAACELFEHSPEELRGRSIATFVPGDEFEGAWRQFRESDLERDTVRLVGGKGTERFVEFAVTPNAVPGPESEPESDPKAGHHLVVVRDVTDRERYERTLATLHESSRELLEAGSKTDVAESIVEAVTGVLSMSAAAVYLFSAGEGALTPAAVDSHGDGEPLDPLPPDRSTPVGAVFLDGEPRTVAELPASEPGSSPAPDPGSGLGSESGLLLPLGDHGVCVIGDAEASLTEADRELAEILTAAAKSALDRVERDAELRDRESELETQNRKLEQLNQLNATIREIDRTLAGADTRREIEAAVCEHLSASDGIALVSISENGSEDDPLVAREWSGDDAAGPYLNAVSLASDDGDLEPAIRAVRTGEPVYEPNVAGGLAGDTWRKAALSKGIRSVLSVPLKYKRITYGTVTVYATRGELFDELSRTALIDLSNKIASTINAVEHQNAVLAETMTEVTIRLTDGSVPLHRVASRVGCSLDLQTTTPRSGGDVSARVRVEGASPGGVTDAAEAVATISAASIVSDADDGGVVEIRFSGKPLADSLADRGVRVAAHTADDTSATVCLFVPDTVDVSWVFDELRERYADPELVSKNRRRHTDRPAGRDAGQYRAKLTPRQQEVLRTAYLSGFFESPRECTGDELADRLDVSSQTVYRHIRNAERKLFETVFDGALNSNAPSSN